MAKRIPKNHFMNIMRKKQKNGMSKHNAFKSTQGYVKSGKVRKTYKSRVPDSFKKIENYYFTLTAILVVFSLFGINQIFSNIALKFFSGLIMGIPGSAIVESILNFFGLNSLKNYEFTWKFWKIKYGITYYAIATIILELILL
ncbi:MAG: hypothetical protein KKF46_05315 [Nanoarchaeota archaeon]|nr:hypothetical protein [Nanoarchaeota archaeon]MBU1597477.1 hypothetical protein [Nanoarchaeota archaeon]